MIDLDKIPPDVVRDIAQNMGWDDDDEEALERYTDRMRQTSPSTLFHKYCNWHGLMGYGYCLWDIVHQIENAEVTDVND